MDTHRPPRPRRRRTGAALLIAAALALAGCATPRVPESPSQSLRALIDAGDIAGADALLARSGPALDARRALDLSIRAGDARAVRHYLERTGVDVELDPDGTTPLIRAVLDAPPNARTALVGLLVEAGARPTVRDRYGRDALTYAATRNRAELVPLLDGSAGRPSVPALPAFATWLGPSTPIEAMTGATATAGPPLRASAPLESRATGLRPLGGSTPARAPAARSGGASPTGTVADAPVARPGDPPTVGLLMRRSPWLPDVAPDHDGELAALRFHADGAADLLRHRPGSGRFEPMPGSHVAWRLDGATLRVAIVGDAFSATCTGTTGPPAAARADAPAPRSQVAGSRTGARPTPGTARARTAPADARTGQAGPSGAAVRRAAEPDDVLVLACAEIRHPPAARAAGWSLDLARALLVDGDEPAPGSEPSPAALLALATGRGAPIDAEAAAPPRPPRLAVTLRGAAAIAACRPGASRPRASAPQPRVLGDWHALDVRRFESAAPLSGRMCAQTVARDAAMAACREAAGAGGGASCRSVGGCPAGQASALAGLPGVDAGWVACDADPSTARRSALAACRADLGCDCQLVALAGHNVSTAAGGACPAPQPASRRR